MSDLHSCRVTAKVILPLNTKVEIVVYMDMHYKSWGNCSLKCYVMDGPRKELMREESLARTHGALLIGGWAEMLHDKVIDNEDFKKLLNPILRAAAASWVNQEIEKGRV